MARKKKTPAKTEEPVVEETTAEDTAEQETLAAEDQPEESIDESVDEAEPTGDEEEETQDAQEMEVEPDPLAQLQAELELAQEEAGRNLENWQRTAAELANFKRRQEEQMKLQRDRIKSEVLQGVISALDDMDLAFQNLPEELDGQLLGWVEGFRLVQRKLHKILDEQNVMPINTEGTFDPNFHEAVSYEDHNDHETDEIIAELRKGYQIGSRVIRPALVRVAK